MEDQWGVGGDGAVGGNVSARGDGSGGGEGEGHKGEGSSAAAVSTR